MRKHQRRVWGFPTALLLLSACAPRADSLHKVDRPSKQSVFPRVLFGLCDSGLPVMGMWKCDPVLVDINGDGALDLAALTREGDGPHVWLGNGRGEWRDESSGLKAGGSSSGGGLSIADVNGDQVLDLVQADHYQGVSVYLGDRAGNWTLSAARLYPADLVPEKGDARLFKGAEDVDVGDVNGDGYPDLVSGASDNGGIVVYLGDGTGKKWSRSSSGLPPAGSANRVMLADVDKDGHLDILASYASGPRVWRGDSHGGWKGASLGLAVPTMDGLYRGLAIGDVNEDGRLDIAAANWVDGPEVYFQQADGSWVKSPDVFPEMLGGAVGLALGDVDGDKHLDMVVSGRLTRDVGFVYGVFLLYGDGQGAWTWSRGSGLVETGLAFTWGIALGDVNGDGLLDVAAGSGGIVATVPGPTEPVVPVRLPVWCSRRAGQATPNETK